MPALYESHCIGCPYFNAEHLPEHYREIRSTPLSMEDNSASVLLIFQAPGVEEWSKGKPVASMKPSSAGMRLTAAFRVKQQTRLDYNITNTVQCFPGKKSETVILRSRDKAPTATARQHCLEWLRKDIELHSYKRIVAFGTHARKAIRDLGLEMDPRIHFTRHPTGGISNEKLAAALG